MNRPTVDPVENPLSSKERRFESVIWHEAALRETAARHEAGDEPPLEWSDAKRELRERAGGAR